MKYLSISAAALFLLAAPGTVLAQSDTTGTATAKTNDGQCNDQTASSGYKSFSEKCRSEIDAWAQNQTGKSITFEGDLAEGTVIPDSVEIIEVPAYHDYGYVMLNDRRMLVDRGTRKVIRVY